MGEHIDINKASIEVLEALKGVGRAKAEAIVNTRERLDFFNSIEDLLQVTGIGRSLLEQNRDVLLCVVPSSTAIAPLHPVRRSLRRAQGASPMLASTFKTKEESREPPLSSEINTLSENVKNEISAESSSSHKLNLSKDKDLCEYNRDRLTNDDKEEEDDTNDGEEFCAIVKLDYDSEELNLIDPIESSVKVSPSRNTSSTNQNDRQITHKSCGAKHKSDSHACACRLGSDTPHQDVSFDLPDVPLSPMRITDGSEIDLEESEEKESFEEGSNSLTGQLDEDEYMVVDEVASLVTDKKQNKRKSEVCSDSKGVCPVKKTCKAIDTSEPNKQGKLSSRLSLKFSPPVGLKPWLAKYQLWSPAQKLVALDSLIEICDIGQVRHIHQIILPQFQRDFISLLPKELALYVLSFLEPKDLLRAAQTCKCWNVLAADNLLWKDKCREAGLEEQVLLSHRWKKGQSVSHMSHYKAAFMRQHRIEMNWRVNPLKPPLVLKGHDDHVITCLQFSGNTIVSGSDDNTLKVWDPNSEKCLRTLTGHTGGVWSSQMYGNLIVSGSTDRVLRVWNAGTGECIHSLYGHTSTVRCLHLHGNKVVSGSRDATLRLWDITTGICEHVLVGHVAAVRCVQYNGKLVVSGAYDFMVKVWNPEREECIHTLQGHTNRVYSLQFDGVHVVSGSLDTSIRVWDVETGQCKHTLMGHQSLTSKMELKNNILISGNADSTVKVWDIITGQCLQTLSGTHKHRSAVTCLQFNNKFVITSSDDGTVKLWDVKTGEFIRNLVTLESGGSGGVVWRIRASDTKLVCAVGSRNGTEETKLLVLDFDVQDVLCK